MNTTSRTVHPMCCTRCMGRGYYFDGAGSIHCDHTTRVDVTGLDDDTERWLALDAECDRMKEAFRRFGAHVPGCPVYPHVAPLEMRRCSCGFSAEWRRVFGASTGVDSGHG